MLPSADTGPEYPLAIAFERNIKATILKKLAINIHKNISLPNSSKGRMMKAKTTKIKDTVELEANVRFDGFIPPFIFETFTQIFHIENNIGVARVIKTASWGDMLISPPCSVPLNLPKLIHAAQENIRKIPI